MMTGKNSKKNKTQMAPNKNAIITGGARGIGFAIAEELVRNGVSVVICSRTKHELEKALVKLKQEGKAAGKVCDVSKLSDCKKLIKFARSKLGSIDVLVNNAGIFGPVGPLETNDPKEWEKALKINLLGVVYCSMLAIPLMKKQGNGKIINLAGAGVGGTKPLPRFSAYYSSKTAVVAFTENLAAELEKENIQVNAISPGGVASALTLGLLKMNKSQVGEEMYQASKEFKEKGGTPPELAGKLVAYLISDKANHITGRLLSAKWDKVKDFKKLNGDQNLYRLRRIDNVKFFEK